MPPSVVPLNKTSCFFCEMDGVSFRNTVLIQTGVIQTLAHGSAGVDQGELLCLIAGLQKST